MMDRWLSDEEREALLVGAAPRRYQAGQFLFHEGDPPGWLAVIREGHVKVLSARPDGGETILSILGPGELLGELSALDGSPRVASVRAIDNVTAALVTPGAFEYFLTRHPGATLALLKMLSGRLRDANRLQLEFGATDTVGRVCRRLLELAETKGTRNHRGIVIDLPITQEELANWIGASRESVAKALRTLRDRGIVETQRKQIVVVDEEKLRARA